MYHGALEYSAGSQGPLGSRERDADSVLYKNYGASTGFFFCLVP